MAKPGEESDLAASVSQFRAKTTLPGVPAGGLLVFTELSVFSRKVFPLDSAV